MKTMSNVSRIATELSMTYSGAVEMALNVVHGAFKLPLPTKVSETSKDIQIIKKLPNTTIVTFKGEDAATIGLRFSGNQVSVYIDFCKECKEYINNMKKKPLNEQNT